MIYVNNIVVIIGAAIGTTLVVILIVLGILKSRKNKKYKKLIENLDYQKNRLDT